MSKSWTVYGYRNSGIIMPGQRIRGTSAVNAEHLKSLEAAQLFLTKVYMQYGDRVHAVIVELENGRDRNGERKVVHRVGQGKAWWE